VSLFTFLSGQYPISRPHFADRRRTSRSLLR
jgi:hypothetical protein